MRRCWLIGHKWGQKRYYRMVEDYDWAWQSFRNCQRCGKEQKTICESAPVSATPST